MPVYQIVKEGNLVLREKAKPVARINDAVIRLLDNLRDTMRGADRGVGLAAPQIGISKRVFVAELPEDEAYYEMINPVLSDLEGQAEGWEGCLSVPGLEGLVPRAERLNVRYTDREGKEQTLIAEGYLARIIQHEYDHLEGVLFRDKSVAFHSPLDDDDGENKDQKETAGGGDTDQK